MIEARSGEQVAFVETLSEICRQLLVLAGLSLFMEVMLPRGELKKYAQFVMGLLVMAALLNPLLGLTGSLASDISASVFMDSGMADSAQTKPADNTEQIIVAGSSLDDSARLAAAQQLTDSLERQIGSLCSLAAGVDESRVKVELNGDMYIQAGANRDGHNWGQVIIILTVAEDSLAEKENICRQIRRTVADFYDLEQSAVQVSVAEYGKI